MLLVNRYSIRLKNKICFRLLVLQVALLWKGFSKKQTLAKVCMRLGEAFEAQVWAKVVSETSDGASCGRSLDGVTSKKTNDPLSRQERALYYAKNKVMTPGYSPKQSVSDAA